MAKLLFSLDGKSLGEFLLAKERMTIGRRPTNDIHIDNLAVSGEHAVILTFGPDSFLEDLNSTNGTMVNKKAIKKHVLLNHDLIEFGKYQLEYIADSQSKESVADDVEKPVKNNSIEQVEVQQATPILEKTTSKTSTGLTTGRAEGSSELGNVHAMPKTAPESTSVTNSVETSNQNVERISELAHLQVLNGDNAGQELQLNRAMVKLGSAGGQLALITKRPQGFFLTHLEGEGRPLVNGEFIGAQAFALKNHDVIELSEIKMEVILE